MPAMFCLLSLKEKIAGMARSNSPLLRVVPVLAVFG